MQKIQGTVGLGGTNIVTSGTSSTTESLGTFPGATVTVFTSGTVVAASIFSDAAGTPKANPFTASSSDASYFFWVNSGLYDIQFSGSGIAVPFSVSSVSTGDYSTDLFNVKAYGAVGNGSTNDRTAIQAAITAAGVVGGTVYMPKGTYYLGTAAQGVLLNVISQNVKIRGDGTITYSSAGRTGTFGSGSAILVGDQFVSHVADGFEISDITITDTNTTALYSGAGPGGVTVYNCDAIRIERLKLNNIKAGGAIIYVGELNSGTVVSKNLVINDNTITGTSAGGWVEGVGINAGNVNDAHIEKNIITGTLRHGIEGGNFRDSWLDDNKIDMQNRGLSGFGTIYGARISISNNDVREWTNGSAAINFAQDANTYPIQQVTISNNRLLNSITVITAGTPALRFQPVAGTAASLLGPISFNNNIVQSVTPIEIYTATTFEICDNQFDKLANAGAVVNSFTGANPTINAADVIAIYDNHTTVGSIVTWPDANWKVKRFKPRNNIIGVTDAAGATDAIDGNLDITLNPGLITAVAMSSATQTSTLTGALVGDEIRTTTDTALPVGCFVVAQVTAGDTLTWRVVNASGADQTIGSTVFRFWTIRR